MQYNCYFLLYHMTASNNLVPNSFAYVLGLSLSLSHPHTHHIHTLTRKYVFLWVLKFFLHLLHINICFCSDIFLNVVKLCHIGAFFI